MLDREGPDLEALAEGADEDEELGGAADIEGWDEEGMLVNMLGATNSLLCWLSACL